MKRSGINMHSLRSDNHIYLWEWKLLDIFKLNVCIEQRSHSYAPNSWWLTQLLFQNLLRCMLSTAFIGRFLLKAKSKLKCNFMSDWFGLLCTALSNRASYVKHKGDLTHSFPLACCQSNDPAPLFYFRTFFTFILAWDYTIDGTHYNPGRTQTYVPESQQRIYVLRMCTVYSSQWYRVKQIIVLFIYFIYIYI